MPGVHNECSGCGRDFGSLSSFDRHRVGAYPQTGPAEYIDRLRAGLVDPFEDWNSRNPNHGRRCKEEEELLAMGLVEDSKGVWRRKGSQAARGRPRNRREASL